MIYQLASLLDFFGPARLLQSYTVLMGLALFSGFIITYIVLPKTYKKLPHDRGREFTATAEAAKGKPTGSGVVFITIFVLIVFVFVPLNWLQIVILLLTWLTMLTGYLDDRSVNSWGEYRKAILDLLLSVGASFASIYSKNRCGCSMALHHHFYNYDMGLNQYNKLYRWR